MKLGKGLAIFFIPIWISLAEAQTTVPTLEQQGSCAVDFYKRYSPRGQNMRVVLRNNAPLYRNSSGNDIIKRLSFNTKVLVESAKNDRVQISRTYEQTPSGWMNKADLLCIKKPLKSRSGLEMKFYIKTETRQQSSDSAEPPGELAYKSYDGEDCGKDRCRKLTRFNGYFVFDERHGRYLLGSKYRLGTQTGLMGWVDKKAGFIWDTAYGIRPRENLVFSRRHRKAGQEKSVCAFRNLKDAQTRRNCIPILGGKRWYKLANRIPVLKKTDNFYRVVMPLPGVGVKAIDSHNIKISPQLLGGMADRDETISDVGKLNHIDLFFLIDGTHSMAEPLKQVIQSVRDIVNLFQTSPDFQEKQLRLGFRIYRDKYAGKRELGEVKPLNAAKMLPFRGLGRVSQPFGCTNTQDQLIANWQSFDAALSTVSTTYNERDDFSENLFGGIEAAIDDLAATCPDHVKVLFIVGDHGYDPNKQRAYGRSPIREADLINGLKGDKRRGRQQIVTFFLHTGKDETVRRKNITAYDQAYQAFENQAKTILSSLRRGSVNDYIFNVNDYNLAKKVKHGFQKFFSGTTEYLEEIKLDLYGGASLVAAIERLKGHEKFNNIPGLFPEIVEQHLCRRLGEQCQNSVTHATIEGYIPVSDDIQIDVWFMTRDFTNYNRLLQDLADPEMGAGQSLRESFIHVLIESLERIIKKPERPRTGESIEVFLRRIGKLPVRHNSPIFRYSLDDLRNSRKVSRIKLIALQEWIHVVTEYLRIAQSGRRPVARDYNRRIIPPWEIFERGHNTMPRGEKFKEEGMSYDKTTSQGRIYWIPQEFLP